MIKNISFSLVFLLIAFIGCSDVVNHTSQAEINKIKASSDQNICTFTYEQGFDVGKSIGSSETYYAENYQMYLNTRDDYADCSDYRAGVQEGYMMYRYQESSDPYCPSCDCILEPDGCFDPPFDPGDDIE